MSDITKAELDRGRKLVAGAVAAPATLTALPAIITLLLLFLAPLAPPSAVVVFFFGAVATALGLLIGLSVTGLLLHRRGRWLREMRERIAADGIRAEEIGWFTHELKSAEKRVLRAVESRDLLLGDAYRETLASRLTATRILKSSKRELMLARKREGRLKQLKSGRRDEFLAEIGRDIHKVTGIKDEAAAMLAEAEARLQMIEAAATRGGRLADDQLALKKLSARTAQLPLALESAKLSEEIWLELEAETEIGE
ncbi:MAG: hypothetical protein KBD94_05085 [Pyrinomonadaceae bacterium]|nr:hypothetical protein [Pyrinomonadaceae bacterium]